MTAQPTNHPEDHQPTTNQPDPIGPISLPERSRIGSRALALVGAAGVFTIGVLQITDGCSTWPTISVN